MTLWENVWTQVAKEMPQAHSRPKSWADFIGAFPTAAIIVAIWIPIRLIYEILKTIDLSDKPDHTQEALDGIRWHDRMRREIARMNPNMIAQMQRACSSVALAVATATPKIAGDGEITSPLSTLIKLRRLVEEIVRPLDEQLFPAFAETYIDNAYRISGVPRRKYAKPPKLDELHHFDDPSPFLDRTPFAGLLATPIPVGLPEAARASHHWIVAGTGAGKTTALQ